jgi:hypothetical protein
MYPNQAYSSNNTFNMQARPFVTQAGPSMYTGYSGPSANGNGLNGGDIALGMMAGVAIGEIAGHEEAERKKEPEPRVMNLF